MTAIYAGLRKSEASGFRIRTKNELARARRELVVGRPATVGAARGRPGGGQSSASARWTSWIEIDPSPTADATRFTLVARASPTQNTPGMLVSIR